MPEENHIGAALRAGLLGRCPGYGKGPLPKGPLTLEMRAGR